jgi:hypothetical protein
VDAFPRTSYGIPGACPSPKKPMGRDAGHGPPLCATFRTGSHLSGCGRGAEPDCGPSGTHARQGPQRSRYQAGARAQRFEASPVSSAPSVGGAQATSHPASGPELPVAGAVTGQAITGVKPASAHTACLQFASAVAGSDLSVAGSDLSVAGSDLSVAGSNLSLAGSDLSVPDVMAETDFVPLVWAVADWRVPTCARVLIVE